jgi:HD superfamily phosphodiesterase
MNDELIDYLANYVENECRKETNSFGFGIWTHHVKPMIPIAQHLSDTFKADKEIVTIATILHDLAGIQNINNKEKHHILGSKLAENILREKHYPLEKINAVKNCILNHRSSVNNIKVSIEEICVADADAIVHMTELTSLFYAAFKELNMSINDGTEWVRNKIIRDWNKLSPKSKSMYNQTYISIMNILTQTPYIESFC